MRKAVSSLVQNSQEKRYYSMPFQDLIGQCNGIVIEHVLTYSLPNISVRLLAKIRINLKNKLILISVIDKHQ